MGVELLAAILTWSGIGMLLDRAWGTAPWFLAIGALIGNFAGLYLVYLRSARMNAAEERARVVSAAPSDGELVRAR